MVPPWPVTFKLGSIIDGSFETIGGGIKPHSSEPSLELNAWSIPLFAAP